MRSQRLEPQSKLLSVEMSTSKFGSTGAMDCLSTKNLKCVLESKVHKMAKNFSLINAFQRESPNNGSQRL